MATFCQNCGFALTTNASFCPQCGNRASASVPQPPPPVYQAAPPAAAPASYPPGPVKSGGGLGKILLIVALIFVLGMAAVAGGVYYAYHRVKQRIEQTAAEHGITIPDSSDRSGSSPFSSMTHKNACDLLSAAEVEQITGIPVARADNGSSDKAGSCEYFAKPEARDLLTAKMKKSFNDAQKSGSSEAQGAAQALSGVRSLLGAATAGTNSPFFGFSVDYENGQAMINAIAIAGNLMPTASKIGGKVLGLGDDAYMDPTATMLAVRKGRAGITLTMSMLPDSQNKGPELARTIVGRL